MDRYLLSSPAGFNQGIAALAKALAASEVANDLIEGAVRGTVRPEETQKIGLLVSRFAAQKVEFAAATVANMLRCVTFISRGASQHCEAGSVKSLGKALVSATNASEAVAAAVAQAWAKVPVASATAAEAGNDDEDESEVPGSNNSFSVGKLNGLDWKLGVRMSSSSCDRLAAPFVRLAFRVADNAGTEETRVVQLSIEQFQKFRSTVLDVSKVLDSA
eukprot:INCI13193.1.p1 GENE.INCI13193.1~~INCI13193.1.p1  ORF type:complete len:218 (+),score=39.54 INCI13193.1:237-890(+)